MTPLVDGSPGKTIGVGLFFLLLSAVAWGLLQHSIGLFSGNQIPGDPGPFFLGFLCATVIAIAGGLLLVIGVFCALTTPRAFVTTHAFLTMLREWSLAAGFVGSLILMPAGMEILGTTLAVGLFATVWVYILLATLNGHSLRHMAEAILFGAASATFVHLFFIRLLTLPLPS